jgi:AAA domain
MQAEPVQKFAITVFEDLASQSKDERLLTLNELEKHLVNAGPYASKQQCPLFKLAKFGDIRTDKNSLRHNENVLSISGIECDYDGKKISIDEAHRLLKSAGVKALLYTSPSHTVAQPRWRLVCPLSNETKPSYRSIFVSWVNGVFAGVLAGESFTLSQAFYFGRVSGAEFRYTSTLNDDSCRFVDLIPTLDHEAIGKATHAESGQVSGVDLFESRIAELGRKLKQGDGKRDLLKLQFASLAHRGASSDELMIFAEGISQKYFADGYDAANIRQLAEASVVNAIADGFTDESIEPQNRYRSLSGGDLKALPPIEWLIKGLVPRQGVAALYGPSGSGKSFLAIDFASAVAGASTSWFGYRVKHAPVIYCALEGETGIRNRVEAWKEHHGRECPDGLRFLLEPIDLLKTADVTALCAALTRGTVVIIDTLNRASPGADENTSKDMGLLLLAIKKIEQTTRAAVIFVHHTGKDADKGLRGHSSLIGAVDASMLVRRGEACRTIQFMKAKDGQDGITKSFNLEQKHLGCDADGDAITSCVIVPFDPIPSGPKLTPQQKLVLKCFHDCDPMGVGFVTDADWRERSYDLLAKGSETNRKAFNNAKNVLIATGVVREVETGWVLITPGIA